MIFDDLALTMIRWGYLINPSEYENFKTYLHGMLQKKRVMLIWSKVGLEAIILFHITNDYETLYKKSLWHIPEDEPDGKQIYVDKMVCRQMDMPLRRAIQTSIESNFPNVGEGYYHRAPCDRLHRIYRRKVRV